MMSEKVKSKPSAPWEDKDVLKLMAKASTSPITLTDDEGNLVWANEAACNMFGYTKEEFLSLGVPDIDLWHPRSEWKKAFDEIVKVGKFACETVNVTKDGRHINVHITGIHVRHGVRDYVLSFVKDISSLVKSQDESLEMKSRLDSVMELATDSFLILDDTGKIIDMNTAALDALGYSKDELVGRHVSVIIDEDSISKFKEVFPRVLKENDISCQNFGFVTKSGEKITRSCYPRVNVDSTDTITSIVVLQKTEKC